MSCPLFSPATHTHTKIEEINTNAVPKTGEALSKASEMKMEWDPIYIISEVETANIPCIVICTYFLT